jgi:hypothetical protein
LLLLEARVAVERRGITAPLEVEAQAVIEQRLGFQLQVALQLRLLLVLVVLVVFQTRLGLMVLILYFQPLQALVVEVAL